MHDITYGYDALGRLVVVSASMRGPMADPLNGMHSLYRRDIVMAPLSSDERQLIRASRSLPLEQRRVVIHYILTTRRATYEHNQVAQYREAKRLRAQDAVEAENARHARYNDYLARRAERAASRGEDPEDRDEEPGR